MYNDYRISSKERPERAFKSQHSKVGDHSRGALIYKNHNMINRLQSNTRERVTKQGQFCPLC